MNDARLVLDFERCTTYSLLAAAEKGRALRAFLQARNEDEACQFTRNWGVLYPREANGQTDRFPLDLFRAERQKLLALVQLGDVLRQRSSAIAVAHALQELKAAETRWHIWIFGREPSDHVIRTLSEHERKLADLGIPLSELLRARTARGTVSLQEHAAQTLAGALQMPHVLRAVRKNREWRLEDTPAAYTLLQVMRWSYRSEYRMLRHFFCEACGEATVSLRSDARFCSPNCGSRIRVRRFRHRLQNQELN